MSTEQQAAGMAVRRKVLGDAHVDRAAAAATDFDTDFQQHITENIWGGIWTREGLNIRDRSLVTVGLLAALGHQEELALHVRATQNTGVTRDEVKEVLMQVGAYAGVPTANRAMAIAKSVWAETTDERS